MITSAPRMTAIAAPTTPPVGKAEPTAPKAVEVKKNDQMGRDEFLKMLVAQMRHQDPLNPMDGQQMATQLAQFSTVEQLIAMNASATEQKAAQQAMATAIESIGKAQAEQQATVTRLIQGQTAAGMVGKVGVLAGDQLLVGRDGDGIVMFDGGTRSGSGRVVVKDAQGTVVSEAAITVSPGEQQLSVRDLAWTPPLAPGQYRFGVEVRPAGDAPQALTTYTAGRITGMRFDNGNPMLVIGDALRVPLTSLTQLRG